MGKGGKPDRLHATQSYLRYQAKHRRTVTRLFGATVLLIGAGEIANHINFGGNGDGTLVLPGDRGIPTQTITPQTSEGNSPTPSSLRPTPHNTNKATPPPPETLDGPFQGPCAEVGDTFNLTCPTGPDGKKTLTISGQVSGDDVDFSIMGVGKIWEARGANRGRETHGSLKTPNGCEVDIEVNLDQKVAGTLTCEGNNGDAALSPRRALTEGGKAIRRGVSRRRDELSLQHSRNAELAIARGHQPLSLAARR